MKDWLRKLFRIAPPRAAVARPPAHSNETGTPKPFSSDQPITTRDQDRFDRWPFAKRIADTLAARTDTSSLVIGMFGAWGDGKTSTLRMMEATLQDHEDVVVVKFNPWNFGSEQQLLNGFFSTLADALGRSLSTRKEVIGKTLKKYGSALSIASISVPGVQIGIGDAATGLGTALSSVALDELRTRLERILEESGTRVIVLIDDIDRLDKAEIQAIFKLVKLSASFNHTSYVLAFDNEMVAASLGERYGEGGRTAGRSFLEKIIQVPLHLPPPDVIELRKLAFDGVNDAISLSGVELDENQVQAFIRHYVDGIEPHIKTPRQSKLYGNALAFALPLLKGEAHPVDLMLIEGVRICYPKLYNAIRDNPDLFLKAVPDHSNRDQHRQRVQKLIDASLDDSGVIDKEGVRKRLVEVLFPRIGDMGYGGEWDAIWSKEQRIRSAEYFQRYFTYSVPPGDIGDTEVEQFLATLANSQAAPNLVDAKLKEFSDRRAMPRLIAKLRHREDTFEPLVARQLAMAVARNGSLLPVEEGMFSIGGTKTQGAILISQLARLLPHGQERDDFVAELIEHASPLSFAADCYRWTRRSSDERDDQHILSESGEATARRVLSNRIRESASKSPLYREFGQDAPHLFWIWSSDSGPNEVAISLQKWLDSGDEEVDQFLDVYVGKAWGIESGLSRRADFRREAYDNVAQLINPAIVLGKLRSRYGAQLDNPQFHQNHDAPLATRIAHQFAVIHRAVTDAQQQASRQAESATPEAQTAPDSIDPGNTDVGGDLQQ